MPSRTRSAGRRRRDSGLDQPIKSKSFYSFSRMAVLALLSSSTVVTAASSDCISLQDSNLCPAFKEASISTNQSLIGLFPFLQFVTDGQSFDNELSSYVSTSFVKDKYQSVLGCSGIKFSNSSDYYARFTTTVICNAIVQNSKSECRLSDNQSRAVCADTCAQYAQSESYVASDEKLCSRPRTQLDDLIRADFVNCALPSGALSNDCITGADNEPDNCGYGNSTLGLCSYCGAGGINSTDTCCYGAKAEDRCKGVKLPVITSTMSFTVPSTSSVAPTSTASADKNKATDDGTYHSGGLTGGDIAGIVVGSVAGVALFALLLFFCCRRFRHSRGSQQGSILNQPSPARKGPPAGQSMQEAPQGYEVLPGGRIARMSALEGHSGDSPTFFPGSSAGYGDLKGVDHHSSSSEFHESPVSATRRNLRAPPAALQRNGSLSSNSVLGGSVPQSPASAGGYSSAPGVASQQSEQLPFFKDYYSQDDIHPGDRVAVLWAYQPRASDEFGLERGEMLKVVGIWDDGWATGVMLDESTTDWEARRQAQRDSGVSNTSGHGNDAPAASGEIKAFPLVCVCLPEHWRKTIDGDGSTDSGQAPSTAV